MSWFKKELKPSESPIDCKKWRAYLDDKEIGTISLWDILVLSGLRKSVEQEVQPIRISSGRWKLEDVDYKILVERMSKYNL